MTRKDDPNAISQCLPSITDNEGRRADYSIDMRGVQLWAKTDQIFDSANPPNLTAYRETDYSYDTGGSGQSHGWLSQLSNVWHWKNTHAEMLAALTYNEGKIIAYVETGARDKARALEDSGFEREGDLRGFLRAGGAPRDVRLFGRIVDRSCSRKGITHSAMKDQEQCPLP